MDQLTIRQSSAELPSFDPETALEPLPGLSADSRLLADFQFGDVAVDALKLDNAQLLRGRIRMLRAQNASITATRMDCVEFSGCDLSSLRWQEGKISSSTGCRPCNWAKRSPKSWT